MALDTHKGWAIPRQPYCLAGRIVVGQAAGGMIEVLPIGAFAVAADVHYEDMGVELHLWDTVFAVDVVAVAGSADSAGRFDRNRRHEAAVFA